MRRLVAIARMFLAAASFLSVLVEDPASAVSTGAIRGLLFAYLAYALAVGLLTTLRRDASPGVAIATHVVDLLVFTALLYLTGGSTSPFFSVFVFTLISATLIWRWQGAAWTSLALVLLFLPTGFGLYQSAFDGAVDVQRFIIRAAYLFALGGVLTFIGWEVERISAEIARLDAWPTAPGDESPAQVALRYAAAVFAVDRAVIAWEDAEEPWLFSAELNEGDFRQSRLPPDEHAPFQAGNGEGERPEFIYHEQGCPLLVREASGALVERPATEDELRFLQHAGFERAVIVPLRSEELTGHLIIPDPPPLSSETVAIAGAVATKIQSRWNGEAAAHARRNAEAADARLRLARDLHDGVLQFLAGVALQIEAIARSAEASASVKARIAQVREELASEQRELRQFIRRIRSPQPDVSPPPLQSGEAGEQVDDLRPLVGRLRRQWGIDVTLGKTSAIADVPLVLRHEVRQAIRESVANAVRHGGATWVGIEIGARRQAAEVRVTDNGRGLAMHGTFGAEELERLRIGPRSLRERAKSLGGDFTVDSTPAGTSVMLTLPFDARKTLNGP